MRILEIGKYISVAYAGMLLAEQGHQVLKVEAHYEPIRDLNKGKELKDWLNEDKIILDYQLPIEELIDKLRPDCVIDNTPIERVEGIKWIKIKPSNGEKGFDAIAQAQAFGEFNQFMPFYIGDTVAGLFAAFLAVSGNRQYYEVGQAEALQKIIEGELMVKKPKKGWDNELYEVNEDGAKVEYRGKTYCHRLWSREEKLKHMNHSNGRIKFEVNQNG